MAASSEDLATVDRWWRHFVAHGCLPQELELVQGRLIRAVHRAQLACGEVFVKVMTFPRAKDRLRYALRALPATHEARLLREVSAAGVACPQVLAVRTQRRAGLPRRSFLVMAALPVARAAEPGQDLQAAAAVALQLLRAGIEHRDLHFGNFVRLDDGRLSVLDLQSARLRRPGEPSAAARIAAAARLLRGAELAPDVAQAALLASGLLADPTEFAAAQSRMRREQWRFDRGRILRCMTESTEFSRRIGWFGVEHRHRGALPAGRWLRGGRDLLDVWLGQRARFLFEGKLPVFPALFRSWRWFGGRCSLYVPTPCETRIDAELTEAQNGIVCHGWRLQPGAPPFGDDLPSGDCLPSRESRTHGDGQASESERRRVP